MVIEHGTTGFAVRTSIDSILDSRSFLAIGSHQYRFGQQWYGLAAEYAAVLGCSFNCIVDRFRNRGKHVVPMLDTHSAESIAQNWVQYVYAKPPDLQTSAELDYRNRYLEGVYERGAQMAPDGSEAFDDGSLIFQFDIGAKVRLVACRFGIAPEPYRAVDISEVTLYSDEFYDVLGAWIKSVVQLVPLASVD
jgi:hypothetical protein